ncbi:MAG: glutathione S-transferase family protein, partial [Pseudomonadota bacterium]
MPELHGYRISVFSWVARWALAEKGVAYRWVEVNPFAEDVPADYLALNPFCRVPTLVDGDFTLFETGAITEYVDEAFDGPPLMPATPVERARVRQIVALVAGDAYWPLVRQVFVHGSRRAAPDEAPDPAELQAGLQRSRTVLAALERLAGEGPF